MSSDKCYFGIFNCYYTPGSIVRTLIIKGIFTSDDLFIVSNKIYGEIGK